MMPSLGAASPATAAAITGKTSGQTFESSFPMAQAIAARVLRTWLQYSDPADDAELDQGAQTGL